MLSAIEIARRVQSGRLSVSDAYRLGRPAIDGREADIQAFTYIEPGAPAQPNGPSHGPLAGLAVAVKDNIDTADMPTEYGSPIYRGHRPACDAAVVGMIKRAGGTIIGKSVTTEFAFFHPGKTRNPHNLDRTPGGSSSGSAAAVAAGMVPLAIGTQTGGSVIRPASFCGIAGYKPSYGLLPTVGVKCFSWILDTVGVFAAGIDDAAFFVEALTGRRLLSDDGDRPQTLAVAQPHNWDDASDEMKAAVDRAADLASEAGARVSRLVLPDTFADAFEAHEIIQNYEAALALGWELDRHERSLSPILRDTLISGRSISAERYDQARRTARRARQALVNIFEGIDCLVMPSAPGPAPQSLKSTGSSVFNRVWTLMGTPCLSVPGLRSPEGLPLGVQVIGPFGGDAQAIGTARWIETLIRQSTS